MDELPVTFVAVKIRNLPSNRFMESMSLSNRVRSLELQMSEFLSTKTSYATATMSGTTIPPGNTAVRPSNRNVTSQPLPRVDHHRPRPNSMHIESDMPRLISTGGPDNISSVAVRNMDAQYDGVTTDDNGSMVNNKPFQTVIKPRRRRHERAVFGNGSDDVITSGLQKHELFVFQVNKSTTDEEVKSFLERKKVHVVNIKRVSAEESASNSYHVILHCRDVRTIINSDFWPSGVGCRRFHKSRQGGPQHAQQFA